MFKKECFTLLLPILFCGSTIFAQDFNFLPPGVSSTSYEFSRFEYDSVYKGSEKLSIVERKAEQWGVNQSSISGSIKEEEQRHTISYQFGISGEWNMGINITGISRKRSSSLSLKESSDTTADSLVKAYPEASESGLGDLELYGMWRWLYTDEHDIRLGATLNLNNGTYSADDPDKLNLGNGTHDLLTFFHWFYFLHERRFIANLKVSTTNSMNTKIKTLNGDEKELRRANQAEVSFGFSGQREMWSYGGDLEFEYRGASYLDSEKQKDSLVSYSWRAFAGYGTSTSYDGSPANSLWDSQIYIKNSVFGADAPALVEIGVKGSLIF